MIIYLHGASSSGKTSIAGHLQELLTGVWLRFGLDSIWAAMPQTVLRRLARGEDLSEVQCPGIGRSYVRCVEALAELVIVAWSRQPTEDEIEQRVARLEETLRKVDPDQDALFVAQRAGRVVGFGRARRDEADAQWLLFALVVHPEHRRQGIAGALARARIEYVRQRGARCVRSETHIENVASIRYHEAMGFRRGDVFVVPDGDRLVPFWLELT